MVKKKREKLFFYYGLIKILFVARGLEQVTVQRMTEGFQINEENPMVGLEGRSHLLKSLSKALDNQSTYFPSINDEPRRPGNLVGKLVHLINTGFYFSLHTNNLNIRLFVGFS